MKLLSSISWQKNNYKVLKQHLEATESRFEVGEVTITDLSQAKARLLRANANEIKTRGEIEIESLTIFILKKPSKLSYFLKM